MNYEEFTYNKKETEQCMPYILTTISLIGIGITLINCLCSSRKANKRTERLEIENSSLKRIILKSVDNTLVKMMKNGYQSDTDDEE